MDWWGWLCVCGRFSMKGESKMVFKSKMKWVGLVGLVLSAFSIFIHLLLARYTEDGISDYQSSVTIFSWRPIFENADLPRTVMCTHTPLKISPFSFCFLGFPLFSMSMWLSCGLNFDPCSML